MTTTTIRLPEALKVRVAKLAKQAGMTTHGYILAAISEKALGNRCQSRMALT